MDRHGVMRRLEELLDDAHTGLLATVDEQGRANLRWMIPVVLRSRPDHLFAFSCTGTRKVADIETNPRVTWLIQNRSITEVITLYGVMRGIDNPALKNEIFENVGARLESFWKMHCRLDEFVILETRLEKAVHYLPMKDQRAEVLFL